MNPLFASVILEASPLKSLDYLIPAELYGIQRGSCVEVPLRNRLQRGFVIEVKDKSSVRGVRSISRCISSGPVVTEDLFELAL
ncbi:MAG: primosomal protein N', partial [Verrucomicrobia bacterium]|nr:primosomal protein N' [Verrucomicrobiota bacterium]